MHEIDTETQPGTEAPASGQSFDEQQDLAVRAAPDPVSRTIWLDADDPRIVCVIDQQRLPFSLEVLRLASVSEMATAISDMTVRGAGCIGVSAGFGMYLAALDTAEVNDASIADAMLTAAGDLLIATRPTAANLEAAVSEQLRSIIGIEQGSDRVAAARSVAESIADDDIEACRRIGEYGAVIIRDLYALLQRPVRILTHCNAGWLAFVEHGSATAPIYHVHAEGLPVEVLVGETRPRSQGALTAWELNQAGVPHRLVADNAVGHLIQRGEVDVVITGADRVTADGFVANKIGTYLRALAAAAHDVPMYVAFPSTTLDLAAGDGLVDIEIEERSPDEVTGASVNTAEHGVVRGSIVGSDTRASNPAFDITPPGLVTGLITERGIVTPTRSAIEALFGSERDRG